jgi:hypothetical protein
MSDEVLIDQLIEEPVEEIVGNPVEEINEPEPEPEKVPKGVQKRIDEITREKYEERRERQRAQERADRLEAEIAAIRNGAQQQQQRQLPNGAPDPDQYPAGRYDPDYLEALTDFKVQARFEAQREQASLQQRKAAIQEAEAKARQQYPDYDHASEEFLTHPLARVPAFTQLVMDTDNPTEIAYYFGKNPVELDKISEMTPSQAARYIGKIEASLADKTSDAVVKKASSAPKPIAALSGAKNSGVITDLSQAKTMAEYNALREKQLAAKK